MHRITARRSQLLALVAALALALALAACGSSSSSSSSSTASAESGSTEDGSTTAAAESTETSASSGESAAVASQLESLYKKAQANGESSVAVGTLTPTAFSEPDTKGYGTLVALFEKLYPGIKVEPVDVLTTPIGERVAAEKKTGKFTMDVALDGDTELEEQEGEGNLAKFTPANTVNLAQSFYKDPKGYAYQFMALYNGMTYNTTSLSEGELPTTWKQLAEPQWKGKFEVLGPTNVLSIRYIAESMYRHTFDADAFKAAIANATITNNFETFNTNVGEGKAEFNIFAPGDYMLANRELGQPLEFANSEATFPNGIWTSVMANAPHPEAARLFDAFLYSQQGQEAVANETYDLATIKGVATNPAWPKIELTPGQIPFQEVAAYTAKAAKIALELYPAGSEND